MTSEQLYASKFEDINVINSFKDKTKFIYEEINNLISFISISEVEFIEKEIPSKKTSGPDVFPDAFQQTSEQ